MATDFPTSLDTRTNPTASDKTDSPSHAGQHADSNDAIEALQAKVGIDSSAVVTSLDYLVSNTSSSNPGHKHTLTNGATDITATAAEVNTINTDSSIVKDNNVGYQAKDTGGTGRNLVNLDASDVMQIGDSNIDGIQFAQPPEIPIWWYQDGTDETIGPFGDTDKHDVGDFNISFTINKVCDVLFRLTMTFTNNDIYGFTPSITIDGGTNSLAGWLNGMRTNVSGSGGVFYGEFVEEDLAAGTYTAQVQVAAAGATSADMELVHKSMTIMLVDKQ